MGKGRYIVWCSLAVLAGDYLGGILSFHPLIYLAASLSISIISAIYRRPVLLLLSLVMLGAAAIQIGRMPPITPQSHLAYWAAHIKSALSDYLESFISEGDELAILKALAIGDKSDISFELKETYRESGAMHLLALSGLHVGIIYKIVSAALVPLGGSTFWRILRSALILVFLWSFALISGMSPSICRAVLMITIYELSEYISGNKDGPCALAESAIITVIVDPEAPWTISFQLSYASLVAIFVIYPRMRTLLSTRSRTLSFVWNSLCLAISCQITCGTLSYLYFGTFPKYFLLTNLLAVPTATAVMYSVSASLLTHNIPFLGHLTASIMEQMIHLLNFIVRTIATLP